MIIFIRGKKLKKDFLIKQGPMKLLANTFFLFFFSLFAIGQTNELLSEENLPAEEKTVTVTKSKVLYGVASYYADKFVGRKTATGAIYSHNKLTAACNVLPLRTWIRVTNLRNKKSVVVQVNDRLHPKNKRIVDMSRMAASQLGYIGRGLTQVKVEVLNIKKTKK